jgi:hypothetical protein
MRKSSEHRTGFIEGVRLPRGDRARIAFGSQAGGHWELRVMDSNGTRQPHAGLSDTRVEVTHGEWTVTLDTYAVSTGKVTILYTRMRAPYVNPEAFRFEVADPAFDHDFIVKGTDEGRLRSLFASVALRELVQRQPQIHLSVKDDEGWFGAKFPGGVDILTFAVPGLIKDIERLKTLFELFAMTLDELCRIGAAYARDPQVEI